MNNSLEFLCPFCNESHEIQVLNKPTQALINGMAVQYEETTYYCEKEQEFFVPKAILKNNLLAARDAYRMQNGLLTSQEIKDARNQYGLTQKEFALLLGWGEVTIQRYETKLIQDETFDQKIKNVKDNPKLALEELEKHKDKFENIIRYNEIKKIISSLIKTKSISYLNKQIIESYYIDFREKSELNGFKELDLEKVIDMISFFAMKSSRLYKVKLMKLLWYSDMLFFKKNKQSMSGLVYEHLPFGAVPLAHEEILKYASKCIDITSEEFDNGAIGYKITPKEYGNLKLESGEIEILTKVIEKLGKFGSKEISDYMHDEEAYKQTDDNDIIPYVFAEKIDGFNIS
ncbi:type II TA system antitoxin MqsA family protein [Solibacillus sp. FSL R7-0668]|uniref:type II TA system antitoxin MqsA family protein n=1 Tax=Solibacillus sp. FSL R7-0668 TaxID=2921688 RepID=UPI0030FCC696